MEPLQACCTFESSYCHAKSKFTISPALPQDFPQLRQELTVQEALDAIRSKGVGEKVVYFHVVDEQERLVGVARESRPGR
jgi:hypothetical protein